ncbi:MAG TPA: Ycf66 family protein [Coleofasciculaceae cyanobacterium]
MLPYILALVVGIGSFALYMAAFFFPEVHRKNDLIWSGVGLFYALVLWVCAGRITGGVLLGQMASVTLLGWFGWQTLTLRRNMMAPEQQTPIPDRGELQNKFGKLLPSGAIGGLQQRITGVFRKGKSEAQTLQDLVDAAAVEAPSEDDIDTELEAGVTRRTATEPAIGQPIPPNPPNPDLIQAAQKDATPDTTESEPVEAIAPDAELAPPAEPTGPGDPEDRKADI